MSRGVAGLPSQRDVASRPLGVTASGVGTTGRLVNIPFVVINRFDGGKITQFTLYFDRAELLGQLGLLPAPS